MCGIAGAITFPIGSAAGDRAGVVRTLTDALARRGPDGAGIWASQDGRVVLGHRRLAIIDLSSAGAQPMVDSTGRWAVTFNGEIYNYRELRRELEEKGCRFTTASDTEVLIQAVAQWGVEGVARLRGMFAFALWDQLNQELWLARDPYGIKPLYVGCNDGTLWFASQARALARTAPVETQRDPAGLVGFYLWGHVPEPFTWWAGVRMFPAGHVQRISLDGELCQPEPYARLEDAYFGEGPKSLEAGELREALLDSVRAHLVADVPVGLFLSAGIDSTTIASLAVEVGADLHTVTLGFEEYAGTAMDEVPLAEATARALGTRHSTVRIGQREFETVVEDFMAVMDQPSIDGLNSYLVSRAASALGLKVALSGLGGDELFGGYPSFKGIPRLLSLGRRVPGRAALAPILRQLVGLDLTRRIPPKAAGLLTHAGDLGSAYFLRRALHLESELEFILDESWIGQGLEALSACASPTAVAQVMRGRPSQHAGIALLESSFYMRNQLLRDADWSSMAHGLEVRLPLVDYHLLSRLGPTIASSRPPAKSDLARTATRLPREVVARPKTGFTTPVRTWIAGEGGAERGLRGWASHVHRSFRTLHATAAAAPQERSAA